jgi:hypothetical protein
VAPSVAPEPVAETATVDIAASGEDVAVPVRGDRRHTASSIRADRVARTISALQLSAAQRHPVRSDYSTSYLRANGIRLVRDDDGVLALDIDGNALALYPWGQIQRVEFEGPN